MSACRFWISAIAIEKTSFTSTLDQWWIALNTLRKKASVAVLPTGVMTGGLLALGSMLFWCNQEPATRDAESKQWSVYSRAAFERTELEEKPVAVLYFANWALSADPKGGLSAPVISHSLVDAGFVLMSADLTDSDANDFEELKRLGFKSVPALVLYPRTGLPVGFSGGASVSSIVDAIEEFGRYEDGQPSGPAME
ncbi:thioredoxin domain-containing protein [Rhodopirellula baltica]|uniref:thiol:disulfide interchange protein n=1 Tax=Rhodopirellula baltica TaxID=265606 RepID=UPI00056D71C3|nr:thiol:disulfide interchange protein [Rhodopirellula baltica]